MQRKRCHGRQSISFLADRVASRFISTGLNSELINGKDETLEAGCSFKPVQLFFFWIQKKIVAEAATSVTSLNVQFIKGKIAIFTILVQNKRYKNELTLLRIPSLATQTSHQCKYIVIKRTLTPISDCVFFTTNSWTPFSQIDQL